MEESVARILGGLAGSRSTKGEVGLGRNSGYVKGCGFPYYSGTSLGLTRTSIRFAPILTCEILVSDTCNCSAPIFLTSIVQVLVYALTRRRIGAIGQRKHWSLIAEKTLIFDLRECPTRSTIAGSNRDRSEVLCIHVHGKAN